jgi:hypothetical protein
MYEIKLQDLELKAEEVREVAGGNSYSSSVCCYIKTKITK